VKEDAEWLRRDPKQEQEWLRQLSLIYSGLIVIGVYMVQPFLTAASLDLSARICVVAFSVAVPLLAALVIVNRQEAFRRRMTKSVLVTIAQVVARKLAPSLAWSPASGTSYGSPGWGCWQAGSWRWRCSRQATGAWNGIRRRRPRKPKQPAAPSHSPFDCERPGAGGYGGQPACGLWPLGERSGGDELVGGRARVDPEALRECAVGWTAR
jgi:hypothetical protein